MRPKPRPYGRFSRSTCLLEKYTSIAAEKCRSLKRKNVSPHALRHSLAMDLLQHGVDRSVISLWLGHETIESTQPYHHANLELKKKALAKTQPFNGRRGCYKPKDKLLAFLQSL